MPSGHAMMAVVLMEFIVRFFARVSKFVQKYIILFYLLVVFFEISVMFSRVILGMHSLNQVLFGCLIGCFSLIPYYLYI
jgi:membrane-associated phospholipid phosphatase